MAPKRAFGTPQHGVVALLSRDVCALLERVRVGAAEGRRSAQQLAAFSQKNRLKCTVSCAKQSEKPGQALKPATLWIDGDASGPVHHIAIAIFFVSPLSFTRR
jgi:hypothetical protein